MGAPAMQYCPLCRGELRVGDAVRAHLLADHKRSGAEADELIARFDTAQPIPQPELEPHLYCDTAPKAPGKRLGHERAAARRSGC